MFNIGKDAKIYLLCPSKFATGGPECIHQLGSKLKEKGFDIKMCYYPKVENPVHDNYKKYNLDYVFDIEDDKKNIVIIPEIITNTVLSLKNIQIGIWRLSVKNWDFNDAFSSKPKSDVSINKDNFWVEMVKKNNSIKNFVFDLMTIPKNIKKYFFSFSYWNDRGVLHLGQSAYARNFLLQKGAYAIMPLSDYLSKDILDNDLKEKENIVLYNPNKGIKITKKIMKNAPDLKFMPIVNMTPKQVGEALGKAKVYIDFGTHPGRDKIPREAAINDCCVITGKRGSANFFEDISIDSKYKFEEYDIKGIVSQIRFCFANYETCKHDFDFYRNIIRLGEKQFDFEVEKIFGPGINI